MRTNRIPTRLSAISKIFTPAILILQLCAASDLRSAEVRLASTFSAGYLTAQNALAYAVGAEAEWFQQPNISLRADLYALAAKSKPGVLQQSYQAMIGLVYTFARSGPLRSFAGFQPGLGFASVANGAANGIFIYPIMSPVLGLHLQTGERWHLTGHLRYVFGELHYVETGAVYLSELRVGVGFGYNY